MRRSYRILVEYDGTDFHGWQAQPDVRTVQGEIEKALETLARQAVRVRGAGRTDAGVHALGQVAAFELVDGPASAERILSGLNALTPVDIAVRAIEEVKEGFSPRAGVRSKTYRYGIFHDRFPSPLLRRTHLHVYDRLDIDAMRRAAALLEGEHDFSAFRASDCTDPNPVRVIRSCTVTAEGHEILIEVVARGFLKNMVRIIAGTLLAVGRGRLAPDDIPRIIASKDRAKAGPTAPAHGLVLMGIVYEEGG